MILMVFEQIENLCIKNLYSNLQNKIKTNFNFNGAKKSKFIVRQAMNVLNSKIVTFLIDLNPMSHFKKKFGRVSSENL